MNFSSARIQRVTWRDALACICGLMFATSAWANITMSDGGSKWLIDFNPTTSYLSQNVFYMGNYNQYEMAITIGFFPEDRATDPMGLMAAAYLFTNGSSLQAPPPMLTSGSNGGIDPEYLSTTTFPGSGSIADLANNRLTGITYGPNGEFRLVVGFSTQAYNYLLQREYELGIPKDTLAKSLQTAGFDPHAPWKACYVAADRGLSKVVHVIDCSVPFIPSPPIGCSLNGGNSLNVDMGTITEDSIGSTANDNPVITKSFTVDCTGTSVVMFDAKISGSHSTWNTDALTTSDESVGVVIRDMDSGANISDGNKYSMPVHGQVTKSFGFVPVKKAGDTLKGGAFTSSAVLILTAQ